MRVDEILFHKYSVSRSCLSRRRFHQRSIICRVQVRESNREEKDNVHLGALGFFSTGFFTAFTTFFTGFFTGFFAVAFVVLALGLGLVVVALALAVVAGNWSWAVVKNVRKDSAERESTGAAEWRARSPPARRTADLAARRDNMEV